MSGFPDIRLYKSDYTATEAANISKEKGSIVFSTKTKRLYVAKQQFGSDVQDIRWKPDTANDKYILEVQKVDTTKNFSILWNNNDKSVYVTKGGITNKIASFDADSIKIKADVLAKNYRTDTDEVIIEKDDSIQNAVQILARQFEKNFVWKEWQDEN